MCCLSVFILFILCSKAHLEKGFGKKTEKKKKRKKRGKPSQPPGLFLPPPPRSAHFAFPGPAVPAAQRTPFSPSPLSGRQSGPALLPMMRGARGTAPPLFFLGSYPTRTQLGPMRSLGNRDFVSFFNNRDPIKLLLQSRSFRLHRSRKNKALDALVKLGWISPGPTLFFSMVRAPRSLSDRIKRVDVFRVSFSPSWCSPFLF